MLFRPCFAAGIRCHQLLFSRYHLIRAGISSYRTEVSDPRVHGEEHVGRYYAVPPDVIDGFFQFGGYTEKQRAMMSLLGDHSIMVRKPALEIIDFLKKTDFSRPVNRFVICESRPPFVVSCS